MKVFTMNRWKAAALTVILSASLVPLMGHADPGGGGPPVFNPFPTPPPKVFCFRITDIERDELDDDRFTIEFEFLNWSNQPAYGAYLWQNSGSFALEDGAPRLAGASIDPDGRGGPRGGNHIGEGVYNNPAHQSGRGRGDIPFHRNEWDMVFRGPTSVFYQGETPIPNRSILSAASSAAQFALVPGLGNDGLLLPDPAIDGGPLPYGTPTLPAPFPAGGRPNPDGSGNVLDGFVIVVDDFDVGEVLSMNWIITDAAGNSIGAIGTGGNVVGDEYGFGLFSLIRVEAGSDELPQGMFRGNTGFFRGNNFYGQVYDIPDQVEGDPIVASFGVEFGPALLAPSLNPNPGDEVPPTVIIPPPIVTPDTTPPNTDIAPCAYRWRGDANGNGIINISDVQCVLLLSQWEQIGKTGPAPGCYQGDEQAVELNCDGVVNVQDVQLVITIVLGRDLDPSIDANGNNCPDSCDCSLAFCDDNNECTTERCTIDTNECVNEPTGCNDGNPCTMDTCDPAIGCVFTELDCAGSTQCPRANGDPCDDGNACTTNDACSGGVCVGEAMACDDGNPCTADACANGLCSDTAMANGTSCNGLNQCIQGFCTTPNGCASDTECNSDACTTYTCMAVAGMPGENKCVVTFKPNCNDGNSCTDDSCNPATGCVNAPNDANTCSDGDLCTADDNCIDGSCLGTLNSLCEDNNECSIDFCLSATACWAQSIDGPECNDGDECTENTFCEIGHCLGDDVDCDDGSVCTIDSCDPAVGCEYQDITCEDGDVCTDNECDAIDGCQFPFNAAPCDDGSVCTDNDLCDGAGVCAGVDVPCEDIDGIACTDEACHPISGCFSTPNSAHCADDGVPCTVEKCSGTIGCFSDPTNSLCNDGISCTVDECDALGGCSNDIDDGLCNDGVACTVDFCGATGCDAMPEDSLCPPSSNPCQTAVCMPTGCGSMNAADGTPCDDGNATTSNDMCTSGSCAGTPGGGNAGPGSWAPADGASAWLDFWTVGFDSLLGGGGQIDCGPGFYCDLSDQGAPPGNVVSYYRDMEGGATLYDITSTFEGIQWNGAIWLFWEDGGGVFHNIHCNDKTGGNYLGVSGAETAQVPPYVCPEPSLPFIPAFGWDDTKSIGPDVSRLHLRVYMQNAATNPPEVRVFGIDAQ